MADLYLKSMDIPATGNTYKIVQPDGYYPDMTAGQITTNIHDTNSVPYVFRPTPYNSTRESGDIVGASVAWNQLAKTDSVSTQTSSDITFTKNADGSYTISGTATGRVSTPYNVIDRFNAISGHKYLIKLSSDISPLRFRATAGISFLLPYKSTVVNCTADTNMYFSFDSLTPTTATINISKLWINIYDLTQMFGSTIADHIYALEQATEGAGVAWFKALFPADYYAYNAGGIESVNVSKHIMRDGDDNIIGEYPLDYSLTLRGILKLDGSNNLYADGDVYEADGTVTRKYGIVDLGTLNWVNYKTGGFNATLDPIPIQAVTGRLNFRTSKYYEPVPSSATLASGMMTLTSARIYIVDNAFTTDAAAFKTAMSGIYLVYELATPTTETADPFQSPQVCSPYGTEEFEDHAYLLGYRDVKIPVGHNTSYAKNIVGAIEGIPLPPSANGTYTLKVTVASGVPTYAWVRGS